jgi:hypothetical protein
VAQIKALSGKSRGRRGAGGEDCGGFWRRRHSG